MISEFFIYSMYTPGYLFEIVKFVFHEYVTTCIIIGFLL